jgi:hypothetical protein
MATYYARKAGNINAADVWATAPAGTASAVTFAAGDVLMANSFAITVNVSTDLGATGEVRNDTTGGATTGGTFTLSNGITLTANIFSASGVCVTFNGTSGQSANIVGNVTGGVGGGDGAAKNASTGTLNITGNVTGGTNSGAYGANNNSTGTLNISGNCTGGSSVTTHGANNASTGVLNITGNATGGTSTGYGANNASTGTLIVNGTVLASEFLSGVGGANRAQVTLLTGPFLISPTFGVNPIGCLAWRWASALNNQTYIEVGTQTLLQKRNLVTPDNATNFPAASNVRSGITYGIGGVVTGTCAVPSPAAVAMGTPVDNTVGTLTISVPTASEIATAVWGASTKTITGGVVDTLTNAPTVPTPSQIASQVRTELSTELSRLDVATSTRSTLTTGDLPSVPSAASVASAVRTELTELSNLDASVSSRLASADYNAPTSAPTAASVANAVWSAATRTTTGGTVDTLTNAPASVTPTDIWSHATRTLTSASGPTAVQIRQEMDSNSTKLANLDTNVGSRAASGTLASDVTAIKAKTDALNVDRVNNTATLSQVGNLLAQANS